MISSYSKIPKDHTSDLVRVKGDMFDISGADHLVVSLINSSLASLERA